MKNILTVTDMTKIYKGQGVETLALDGASLGIAPGEMVAITGKSGCGKTTLLNILGLIDTWSDGQYYIEEKDAATLKSGARSHMRNTFFGYVFQAFHLIPTLSALENVALPLGYGGVGGRERKERAAAMLEAVGLANKLRSRPTQLSGGQQQRVAIARAMVTRPKVLLADEPTGNLDSASGDSVMALLHELHEKGTTIVMVTHDNALAMQAGRIVRMLDGKIVAQETGTGRPAGTVGTEADIAAAMRGLADEAQMARF